MSMPRPLYSDLSTPRPSRRPPRDVESLHALRTKELNKFLPPKVSKNMRISRRLIRSIHRSGVYRS